MSTFSIPNNQGQVRQIPNSSVRGELFETFGIDLTSDVGKIKASKKLLKVKDGVDNINFNDVVAFATYNSFYYVATDASGPSSLYRCPVTSDVTVEANWAKLSINGTIQSYSDMTVYGGLLLTSTSTDIVAYNGTISDEDWWTTVASGTALTSARPHILHTHKGGQETLFITDGVKVRYYNGTAAGSIVTLGADMIATCIVSGTDSVWVGTYTSSGGNAYVYEIYVGEVLDSTPVARRAIEVDGRAILSIQTINGLPHIVTEKGNLQAFNGSSFETVASFPFAFTGETLEGVRSGAIEYNNLSRPIHPKGMKAHNNSLYINVNTEMYGEDKTPDRTPSGVWEYNRTTGNLNHRYSFVESASQNGSMLGEQSGPLMIIDNSVSFLLAGFTSNGEANGMFAEDKTSSGYGYIVTSEINSQSVTDAMVAAYLKAKTLTGNDSITLKYRIAKKDRQVVSGTLMNANTFNTTATLDVEVGDELTTLNGTNTGICVHVTSVSTGTGTTSIELDTDIGTAGDTLVASFMNFKKLDNVYTSADKEFKKFGINEVNTWVQYKLVFDGDVELRQFMNKGTSKNEA